MLIEKVQNILTEDANKLPADIAKQLNISEAQVVFSFPAVMSTKVHGTQAESLLLELSSWGDVTTIIHSDSSIFEVKAPFPKGKNARGYYNLIAKKGQLHGHLRLDLVTDIVLVSKPFMCSESHYFGFFNAQGNTIFKIYLGRDKKRQLLSEQVIKFKQLKVKYGKKTDA